MNLNPIMHFICLSECLSLTHLSHLVANMVTYFLLSEALDAHLAFSVCICISLLWGDLLTLGVGSYRALICPFYKDKHGVHHQNHTHRLINRHIWHGHITPAVTFWFVPLNLYMDVSEMKQGSLNCWTLCDLWVIYLGQRIERDMTELVNRDSTRRWNIFSVYFTLSLYFRYQVADDALR